MNRQPCLAGVSALAFSSLVCRALEGTPHLLLCSVQIFVRWMGKVRAINSMEWFQLEGGKKNVVLKCFRLKGTTDFPSPHISSVWMLFAAAHNWKKKKNPSKWLYYGSEFLDFWLEASVRHSFHSSLHPLSGRLPLRRAWTRSSCWVRALLSSQARLPQHVSGLWPHTQHQRARLTLLLQPALLPGVARGVFSIPQAPRAGRPWLRRPRPTRSHPIPHQLPKLQQLVLLLPVCQQNARSGEERTAGLKQQWIKREGR